MNENTPQNNESEPTPIVENEESNPVDSPKSKKHLLIAGVILVVSMIIAVSYAYLSLQYSSVQGTESGSVQPVPPKTMNEIPVDEPVAEDVVETVELEELLAPTNSTSSEDEPAEQSITTEERIEAMIPTNSKFVFKYDEFSYIDDSGEYVKYYSLNLDPDTFEYINEDYVKDAERLYYREKEVYGFDPSDCSADNIAGCRHDVWQDTITPYNLEVQWYEDLVDASSLIPTGGGMCVSHGYQVGLVSNGPLANQPVYIQSENICGMWCGGYYELKGIHHVEYEGQLIPVRDEGFTIAGVDDFPEKIVIPDSDLHLNTLGPAGFSRSSDTEGRFLFADPQAGDIYDSNHGNYHSVRDDHIRMEYHLEFPFYDEEEGSLKIDFDDGTKNEESYSLNGGYGASFWIEEVPGLENRVVRIGQFTDNHPVYYLINSNDALLQGLYNSKNTLATYQGVNKYTYDEFISHKPLLYWKNPFGDWVRMLNSRYETAAEKCKPVIYLYPEEIGDFEVYVEPNGGFTETIPEYGDGWKVSATPDSVITDKSTGEEYPYLYWEGINTGIPEITEGWVVNIAEIEEFLNKKLSILGMNEKEIADFNEYWVDRLNTEGSKHYKIMFLPQEHFEAMSPLTIVGDEKPASIIRVMMYAQPAGPGETLPEQVLPTTPKRYGFTVVEWGGAVLN